VTDDGSRHLRATFIGRQGIFDAAGDVVAYELLYRDSPGARSAIRRGASATAQVLVAAFTEFLLDDIVGPRAAFINISPEYVLGHLPLPVEPGRVGVELSAAVTGDVAHVVGARALAARGFTIVVDGYRSGQGRNELLPYATYAKVDFLDADDAEIERTLTELHDHPHVQMIAHRLQDERAVAAALRHGFHLFQGNALGHAHVLTTQVQQPDPQTVQQLTALLTSASVTTDRVVELIAADPSLTRYARYAAGSNGLLAADGTSAREAVLRLGVQRLADWVRLAGLLTPAPEATCPSPAGVAQVLHELRTGR
jgi:EAL and modified HD-GYP domain-containing signal transduction protein